MEISQNFVAFSEDMNFNKSILGGVSKIWNVPEELDLCITEKRTYLIPIFQRFCFEYPIIINLVLTEGRPEATPGGGIRTSIAAMATMPRHHMHHISNGNGYPVGGNGYPGGHPGGQQWTASPPPPPPPPHQHGSISGSGSIPGLAGSSATLPIKKKSVTIG